MPESNKVIRHSREQISQHEGQATEAILAGQLVEETGDGGIQLDTGGSPTRVLVAKDDRERGMEITDEYEGGELAKYIAVAGGGVNLLLAAGETVDASAENRLVPDGNGNVRPFDGANDAAGDEIAVAQEDVDNAAGADPVPIATEVSTR